MEDQTKLPSAPETNPSPAPTMDIKPTTTTPSSPLSQTADPIADNATISVDENVPTSTPVEVSPAPISDSQPSSDSAPPEAPSEPSNTEQPKVQQPKMGKKKGNKTTVMLIVIIAILLAGGATYFYLKNNKKTDSTPASSTTTQTNTTPAPVTSKDVDSTVSDVDAALKKADSAGDVSSADLSNTSLGL